MRKDIVEQGGFRLRLTRIILCVGLAMAVFISTHVSAQEAEKYPRKAVDIIFPYSAGSGTDMLARLFAEELSKKWGQPVNVVNKPGGAGVIGTHAVMSAPPDGYTLLFDLAPTSSSQIGMKGLPYEVLNRSFIARVSYNPEVIVLAGNLPYNSLQQLSEAGRKDPASIVWGAASGGRGAADLAILQFFEAAGIDSSKTRRVDFTGTSKSISALAGEHVKLAAASPAAVIPVVSSGKARAIAVTVPKRISTLPDVPTTREAGFPTVDWTSWQGFSGPPGIPIEVQEIITEALKEILKDPNVIDKIGKRFNAEPAFIGPRDFKAYVIDRANQTQRLLKLMVGGK
jgi:tripartite-type tricarboxylate transporter receptor subunit TctC